jgi:sporulation protein YlmC with PRC-barrel domain
MTLHSESRLRVSQGVGRFLRCLTVGLIPGVLILAQPHPVFSQAVQLVRVNVQVVADGYRASKLTGHTVVNDQNQDIGKIDDLVVGRDEGHSLFMILQIGGFLGLGSHLVAVPYTSLVIDQNANKIQLPGATKEQLEALGEFRYRS